MEEFMKPIYAILATTPARWQSLAQFALAAQLNEQPLAGEWSAMECLQHLIDTERLLQFRLQAILHGQDFAAFFPDSEGTKLVEMPSPKALVEEFCGLRNASLQTLATISTADLERRVRHQELGIVSLDEMLNEWAAHDLNHIVQAERALMQPFIRRCGPWQKYFTDHDVRSQKG